MKKFKSILIVTLAAGFLLSSMSSCVATKTNVGRYNELPEEPYQFSKGKQLWLFWGLLPLGRKNVSTPYDGDCQVHTRFNFGDVLISALTGGILTSYTIKVNVKKASAPASR